MLPAVKPRVDGPLARPDQRQRHAKHRQSSGDSRVSGRQKRDRHLAARHHNAGNRRPQTGHEQEAAERSNYFWRRNRTYRSRGNAVQQGSAYQQPLQ